MTTPPARTRAERLRDTRAMLAGETDCWVASASAGVPHLVALSFGWDGGVVTLATPGRYRTALNLRTNPEVKLAFGTLWDVVIVDGTAVVTDLDEIPSQVLDRFAEQAGWDPRASGGNAFIEVTPRRVLAWRHENELAGRVLMRDGEWLDDKEDRS